MGERSLKGRRVGEATDGGREEWGCKISRVRCRIRT